jgi:hypothetical protein
MFRPIRVDHTNCLQVAIKTHSFIHSFHRDTQADGENALRRLLQILFEQDEDCIVTVEMLRDDEFESDGPPGPQTPCRVGISGTVGPAPPRPAGVVMVPPCPVGFTVTYPVDFDDAGVSKRPKGPERPRRPRTEDVTQGKMRFLLHSLATF